VDADVTWPVPTQNEDGMGECEFIAKARAGASAHRHSVAEGLHAHCPNSDWRREIRPAMA